MVGVFHMIRLTVRATFSVSPWDPVRCPLMVAWHAFIENFVLEVCEQTLVRQGAEYKRPFTLTEKQLVPILTSVFSRLGWVSEGERRETTATRNIYNALERLEFHRPALSLTIVDVAAIFECISMMGKASSSSRRQSPCPHDLLREAETKILFCLRQKLVSASVGVNQSLNQKSVGRSGQRGGLQLTQCQSQGDGSQQSSPTSRSQRMPLGSPGFSEASPSSQADASHSALVLADSSEYQVSAMVAIDGDVVKPEARANFPRLPPDLNDMTASQLRKFILMHQANWMRVADRLVAQGPYAMQQAQSTVVVANAKRCQQRKVRYWKGKAAKMKREADKKIQTLVKQNQMYISSKRRKKSAVGRRLTTFGGYRLALARNIGHSSCASTLVMLDCDATHVSTLARSCLSSKGGGIGENFCLLVIG